VKSAAPVQRSRSGMGKMIGVEYIYNHKIYIIVYIYNVYITNNMGNHG
jgi:hypothetical protein